MCGLSIYKALPYVQVGIPHLLMHHKSIFILSLSPGSTRFGLECDFESVVVNKLVNVEFLEGVKGVMHADCSIDVTVGSIDRDQMSGTINAVNMHD